jgi:hypothetical protein
VIDSKNDKPKLGSHIWIPLEMLADHVIEDLVGGHMDPPIKAVHRRSLPCTLEGCDERNLGFERDVAQQLSCDGSTSRRHQH